MRRQEHVRAQHCCAQLARPTKFRCPCFPLSNQPSSEYPGPFGGTGSGPGFGSGSGSAGGKFGSPVPGVSGVGGVVTGSSGRGPGSSGCSGPGCRANFDFSKMTYLPERITTLGGMRNFSNQVNHGESATTPFTATTASVIATELVQTRRALFPNG